MASPSAPTCASAPARVVSEVDVVAMLRAGVDEAGSLRAYARQRGVNANDLSSILSRRKAPGRSFLRAVGVRSALVIDGGVA